MLRYWHVTLLVVIALMWKIRPTTAAMDICDPESNITMYSMYCNCDPVSDDQIEITCFILGPVNARSEVWDYFRSHENAVALTFKSRMPEYLSYVPTRVLHSLPSLETLTIQQAKLGVLESRAISNMPKLKNLWLVHNELTSLERHSVSDLPKLQKLTLSENYITEVLSDTFIDVDELELLFLDTNNISRIEGCAFCNLHNLKELELWRNSITDLTEHTFRGLRYLHRLDLYSNKLSVINDNVFQAMPKLRELNLKSNLIHYISPRAFENMTHLTTLYLNNNHLKSLSDVLFKHVPALMVLDISDNKLETITNEMMEGLRNKQNEFFTFHFKGNPLRCSCDLSWAQTYLKKSRSTMFMRELSQLTCLNSSDTGLVEVQSPRLKECAIKMKKKKPLAVRPTPLSVATAPSPKETSQIIPLSDIESKDKKQEKLDQIEYTESITVHTALQESPGAASSLSVDILLVFVAVLVCVRT